MDLPRAFRARGRAQQVRDEAELERARIARELNDAVAHSLSVMTVQASAVRRLLRSDQERERDALVTVEETGREALAEMRRLLELLGGDEERPSLAPQPGLDALDRLVEEARQAGLTVELSVEGDPVALPVGLDLSAYRIVQEGLAATLRHVGSSRAWVALRYRSREVEVEVANDGPAGDGAGLAGIRERVSLCEGELTVGPRPDGGHAILARLPVRGSGG